MLKVRQNICLHTDIDPKGDRNLQSSPLYTQKSCSILRDNSQAHAENSSHS